MLRAKYLPRKLYATLIGSDIAWTRKKGMGSNLRWDLEVVRNPRFAEAFAAAYRALDYNGFAGDPFRKAHAQYVEDVARDAPASTAGTMMNGFMLGTWLGMKFAAAPVHGQQNRLAVGSERSLEPAP